MTKQFLLFFSILFLFISCGYGGPKKPKNLISKEMMVHILIDARLLGSATYMNKQKMQEHGIKLDSYVFEKYGIDSLQFALSNSYYAHNLKDYEDIYNTMMDSLENLKTALNDLKIKEEEEQAQRTKDSIETVRVKDSLNIITKKDSLANRF